MSDFSSPVRRPVTKRRIWMETSCKFSSGVWNEAPVETESKPRLSGSRDGEQTADHIQDVMHSHPRRA